MLTDGDVVALQGGVLPAEFEDISGRWIAMHGGQRAAIALLSFAADADAADRLVAVGVVRGLGEAASLAWRGGPKRAPDPPPPPGRAPPAAAAPAGKPQPPAVPPPPPDP